MGYAYVELIVVAGEAVEEEMAVYLGCDSLLALVFHRRPCMIAFKGYSRLTCGFTSTKSIKSTTKSCSTYLSANRLHRGHWVNLTSPPPPDLVFLGLLTGIF